MHVHSWIFRNRARLRLIYGTPTPAVSQPSDEVLPEHLPQGVEERVEGPLAPPSADLPQKCFCQSAENIWFLWAPRCGCFPLVWALQ